MYIIPFITKNSSNIVHSARVVPIVLYDYPEAICGSHKHIGIHAKVCFNILSVINDHRIGCLDQCKNIVVMLSVADI